MKYEYVIYDDRARSGDTEDAAILEVCDSLGEARGARKSHSGGCIWKYEVTEAGELVNGKFAE